MIGGNYTSKSKYDQAIEFYKQALAIRREIKDKAGELETLIALGDAYNINALNYNQRGLYAQAKPEFSRLIEIAQETLTLARELKNPDSEAQALTHLGSAYIFFKDYPKAEASLQEAVRIARQIKELQTETTALSNLALIYNASRFF